MTAPLPDAIDSRLDRMLAGMEWELRRSRRSRVTDGAVSTVLRDTAGFVFLHDGRAAVRAAAEQGWTAVAAGDLVLVPRRADLTVRGDGGAEATVVELTRPRPRGPTRARSRTRWSPGRSGPPSRAWRSWSAAWRAGGAPSAGRSAAATRRSVRGSRPRSR
ncbi:cupin domain-containing protein [Pseudonocardia sp. ICBG601]|uniref:cupin domain-containing protein n=1 Tax=Pseudonocardia sp. ICBG601 TaxID=2846759 RepID=UPI001CF6FE65|nr:cupin domain-containing protein [Pseudonocardia sp. ICBG601]